MKYCPRCRNAFADTETACPEHGGELQYDPLIGADLGNFHIETWLGEGGMAVLYRAEHREIKLKVAVKVIKREYIEDASMSGRFVQEARMVAQLRHPHLIDIFDIGTLPDGRLYYVMELLVGRSLSQRMRQGRLSFHEFAPLFMQACEALELAHQQGIVHRDLKPDNLFIVEQPGEPPRMKVLDFGVAKVLRTDENLQEKLTRTGYIMGTPQYMAPEQIDGSGTDHRADIYAMGVILYELATGALPFQAQTLGAMLKAHLLESPPIFEQGKLAPGVPIELEAVVFKALVKKRDDRYGSIHELRVEIERLLQAQPPAATQWWVERATAGQSTLDTLPGHLRTTLVGKLPSLASTQPGLQPSTIVTAPRRSNLYVALGAGAALLLLGTGLGVYLHGRKSPPDVVVKKIETSTPVPPPPIDLQKLKSQALKLITPGLADGDPDIRRAALQALAASKDSRHRTLVEPLLRDAALDVRRDAATCLSSISARQACQALREVLGQDPALDLTLGEALVQLRDPEGMKVLEKLLKRGRADLQLGAAMVLVEHKNRSAESLLKKRLGKLPPTDPSALALLGRLAKAGDGKALAKLAEHLESSDAQLQLLAAHALAHAGDPRGTEKLTQIAHEQGPLQLVAYGMLAALEDPSGYDVFRDTLNKSENPIELIQAAQGLGATGEKSALSLLRRILDKSEQPLSLRVTVAGAVLAIVAADPQELARSSFSWASNALDNKDWLVRAQGVAVLADTNPKTAVPLLEKAIKDAQPEVRQAAAKVLGKVRVKEAAPILGKALKDGAKAVRIAASRSLTVNPDKAVVVQLLTEHLAQAPQDEKVVAATGLLALGEESGTQVIKDGLKSNDPEVRRLSVEGAANAKDKNLQQDALALGLKDPSFDVRFQAAMQLADKSSKDGVKVLQEAVKKGGTNALAGYAALLKLGVTPPKLNPLDLFKDHNVDTRIRALELAPQLPMGQILSFIRRGLADEDPRVRLAGMDALASYAGDDPIGPRVPMVREVLKKLVGDSDDALAAKAGVLLAKLSPPPRPEEDPPEGPPPSPEAPQVPPAASPDLGVPPDFSTPPDLTAPPDMTPPPDLTSTPSDLAAPTVATPEPPRPEGQDEWQVLIIQGEAALKAGKYAKAITFFRQALKLNPKAPVYFQLGLAYRGLGDNTTNPVAKRKAYQQSIDAHHRWKHPQAPAYIKETEDLLKEVS